MLSVFFFPSQCETTLRPSPIWHYGNLCFSHVHFPTSGWTFPFHFLPLPFCWNQIHRGETHFKSTHFTLLTSFSFFRKRKEIFFVSFVSYVHESCVYVCMYVKKAKEKRKSPTQVSLFYSCRIWGVDNSTLCTFSRLMFIAFQLSLFHAIRKKNEKKEIFSGFFLLVCLLQTHSQPTSRNETRFWWQRKKKSSTYIFQGISFLGCPWWKTEGNWAKFTAWKSFTLKLSLTKMTLDFKLNFFS